MTTHLKYVAAAALAIGGMSNVWAQDSAADKAGRAADRAGDAAQNAADKTGTAVREGLRGTSAAPDAEGIRDVFASSTEAALKPGGFNDLVERFVDADRNRLGKAMPDSDARKPLDDKLKQFRTDWKAKYNQEFDFPDKEEDVFKPEKVKIIQGEVGSAITAGARSDATGVRGEVTGTGVGTGAVGADPAAPATPAAGRDAAGNTDLDRNREAGRNIATVMIPASHGLPAINVPMIHELPDNWRIDIPDNVEAGALHAKLVEHLTKLHDMKSQWPADVNDAYLAATHHVLMAIFEGSPAVQKGGAEAQPAAGTISPGASPSATPATPATPAAPGAAQ